MQRNFKPVVCVAAVRHTHTPQVQNYAAKHPPSKRHTSVNHYE